MCRDPEASGALGKPSVSAPASQPSTELPVVRAEEDEVDTVEEVAALARSRMLFCQHGATTKGFFLVQRSRGFRSAGEALCVSAS